MNQIISWPGSKYRQLKDIIPYCSGYTAIVEPFLGGGAVSLEAANQSSSFLLAEKDLHLLTWWKSILYDTSNFIEMMHDYREYYKNAPVDRVVFNNLRDTYNKLYKENPYDSKVAAMLWVLIYVSTNNLARFNLSGGYNQTWGYDRKIPEPYLVFGSQEKDTIKKISDYGLIFDDAWKCLDHILENKLSKPVVFLDPPYLVRQEVYGHKWTLNDEDKLWNYIDLLESKQIDWIMTNYLSKDILHPYKSMIESKYQVITLDRGVKPCPGGRGTPSWEVIIKPKRSIGLTLNVY